MKFVTFNIRYDCGEDGINNFDLRKPFILKRSKRNRRISSVFRRCCPMWPCG